MQTRQVRYIQKYLDHLSAKSVIEEPTYFDRDYLSEFSAFYSVSSKPYPHTCRRLHFFSTQLDRGFLRRAAGGSTKILERMQSSYLGFVILRPIPAAPLGRTVLKWYDDDAEKDQQTPRVKDPSREYSVHFAGIELTVNGLAWQQQDTGVAACATVSLWSMLHSSALDDHHAIPTTAEITRAAHSSHSFGSRVFPSQGLNFYQICDAIREQDLAALLTEGDISSGGKVIGFSRERFASTCASYIRSGYPVLISGYFLPERNIGHAICVVGFRSSAPLVADLISPGMADSNIEHLYIHDDNLGPNVRFEINSIPLIDKSSTGLGEAPEENQEESHEKADKETEGTVENESSEHADQEAEKSRQKLIEYVVLSVSDPYPTTDPKANPSPTSDYEQFVPTQLIVAAHNNIRTSPDTLHKAGLIKASYLSAVIRIVRDKTAIKVNGLIVSSRFIKLSAYLGDELEERLHANRKVLSRVRLSLSEKVGPMSLHIGVIRISLDDSTPLIDIIYDTTDSDRNHPLYCHVAYSKEVPKFFSSIQEFYETNFGKCVRAY